MWRRGFKSASGWQQAWGAQVAQQWDHSPLTKVTWVRFPDLVSCEWVCWFSPVFRGFFSWVLWFSSLLKNKLLNSNSVLGFHLDWSLALVWLTSTLWWYSQKLVDFYLKSCDCKAHWCMLALSLLGCLLDFLDFLVVLWAFHSRSQIELLKETTQHKPAGC